MKMASRAKGAAAAARLSTEAAIAPATVRAQGPTLRDALRRADSAAFRVRGAAAQRAAAEAQALRPLGGILPTVRLEAGYLQTTDPVAAFANLARALEPGGRLAFVCWQGQPLNEWVAVPALAMLPIVGPPDMPPADAPGPFAFADQARVAGILAAAGYTDVVCEAFTPSILLGGGLGLDETVDPLWAVNELPDALPVQGNLDPLALIAGGEALETAVARILDAFAGRPHIFNLGHGILKDTPIAHVERLVGLVKGGN